MKQKYKIFVTITVEGFIVFIFALLIPGDVDDYWIHSFMYIITLLLFSLKFLRVFNCWKSYLLIC